MKKFDDIMDAIVYIVFLVCMIAMSGVGIYVLIMSCT